MPRTSCILKIAIARNIKIIGDMARFNNADSLLFHKWETESTSDKPKSTMKQAIVTMPISGTPIVVNVLMVEDVVLRVLVTVIVLLIVLESDDNI
jgi:hypothetical protein